VKQRTRLLALGGVIGPLAFIGCWAVAGAVTAGYSAVDDAISDLAAVGASTRVAMTTGFLVFGVGLIAFGMGLRMVLAGPAWIAAVVTGAGTIGVAATPLGGWSGDAAHAVCAGIGYLSLVALPLLAAAPFAANGRRGWARASVSVAVVSGACLVASTLGPAHGFWQRAGLTVGDAWIVTVAVLILAGQDAITAGRIVASKVSAGAGRPNR
jgi:hypothetical membrane protein